MKAQIGIPILCPVCRSCCLEHLPTEPMTSKCPVCDFVCRTPEIEVTPCRVDGSPFTYDDGRLEFVGSRPISDTEVVYDFILHPPEVETPK